MNWPTNPQSAAMLEKLEALDSILKWRMGCNDPECNCPTTSDLRDALLALAEIVRELARRAS